MKYLALILLLTFTVSAQTAHKNSPPIPPYSDLTEIVVAEENAPYWAEDGKTLVIPQTICNELCTCGGEIVEYEGHRFCVKCSKETKETKDAWINIGHPKDWVWWEWLIAGATALGYLLLVRLALTGN